jgi:hypothetical protein
VRRQDGEPWVISLFLVNHQQELKETVDEAWLFQPELTVSAVAGDRADIFVKRQAVAIGNDEQDPLYQEDEAMRMLYREQLEFAVGHGVSVRTKVSSTNVKRAEEISLAVVPSYEVPKVTPPQPQEIPGLAGLVLDMKELATEQISASELAAQLQPLINGYQQWIEAETTKMNDPASDLAEFQAPASANLAQCRKTLARLQAGINLLVEDEKAAAAFRFMNRAMWQQRVRGIAAEMRRRQPEKSITELLATADHAKNRTWYPFQLAFVLLNLPSITQLDHPERNDPTEAVADLLWFPTGGGKTEAYLGLTAYTLALRRLQGTIAKRSGQYGVAVLMRYTLRLLTLQQFQRAAVLICACEMLRREAIKQGDLRWGNEPFRLGLWVGQKTTPNTTLQSMEAMEKLRKSSLPPDHSPHQLTNCPWCGANINPKENIEVLPYPNNLGRTIIYCGDEKGACLFSQRNSQNEGLPLIVVDQEIYRRLPALLIATVDKFAQMPWVGETQMLFGQVDGYCERHGFSSSDLGDGNHSATAQYRTVMHQPHGPLRPPDLIIQDELHLISGPLGTLVGFYETAVDELGSWIVNGQKVRPKVVASTATIRQAAAQIKQLFLRQVQVFPPPGLTIKDNFFARQREPQPTTPGRRYLGICALGRGRTATLLRVYTAMLGAAKQLYDQQGILVDPWMTLVGYFNSLRELAGMRRRIDDNLPFMMQQVKHRGLGVRGKYLVTEELTSRKRSADIPAILDRLEKQFDPATVKNAKDTKEGQALDVLLATNMLSVGVDVRRLGAMVVTNQPKNTAEYIQATSRIGRSYPGLVVTVYHWIRPRDLSHYETFAHYHATFYQHVEALSVTPFASGAIKRGLAGLLVSLMRLSDKQMNGNDCARFLNKFPELREKAINIITQRATAVAGDDTGVAIKEQIEKKFQAWQTEIKKSLEGATPLVYSASSGKETGLLVEPTATKEAPFICLRSLRNVEPMAGLVLNEADLIYRETPDWCPPKSKDGNDDQFSEGASDNE